MHSLPVLPKIVCSATTKARVTASSAVSCPRVRMPVGADKVEAWDVTGLQRLADQPLGRRWIANFDPEDQSLAATLLNQLRVVKYGELRDGLLKLLKENLTEKKEEVCLFQVRKPRAPTATEAHPECQADCKSCLRKPNFGFVAEPDTNRPDTGNEGSEILIAHLLRDLRIDMQRRKFRVSNYLSVPQMRQRRTRRIILVDDYSGSGDKFVNCLDAWLANPHIRSWISFNWLRIDYAAFAISSTSHARIASSILRARGAVHSVELGRDFGSLAWDDELRNAAVRLCLKYANKPGRAGGWSGSFGLMLFAHSTPNNLPAIFTQTAGNQKQAWVPLAERRNGALRDEDIDDVSYKPDIPLVALARISGQSKVERSVLLADDNVRARIILALGAIVRRRASPEYIAEVLKTSPSNAARLIKSMARIGLIDERTMKLTDEGWDELRHARKTVRPKNSIRLFNEPHLYYPAQLRRGGDDI